jgi:hypothetical protein
LSWKVLHFSGACAIREEGFDKLSPNGTHTPFALSLSKGWCRRAKGFDKLSPNGFVGHAVLSV